MDNNKNNKSKENFNNVTLFGLVLLCFTLFMVFNNLNKMDKAEPKDIFTSEFVEQLKTSELKTVSFETAFECKSIETVYTKSGTKQYNVSFRNVKTGNLFNVVMHSAEIDVYERVIEGAKYEGTIDYLYFENGFIDVLSEVADEDKEFRIIGLLQGQSDYAKLGTICGISFMFEKYVEDYSVEKATESLNSFLKDLTEVEEPEKKESFFDDFLIF